MSTPNLHGARIGRYILADRIGKGTGGNVYAARDWETNKPVAVKLLTPELGDDEEFRKRFQVEINVLRTLDHPNIPEIYESGEETEILYFAMQLVQGKTLRSFFEVAQPDQPKTFSPNDTWKILNQAAQALDYAHRHDIIHRDVKPENIMIEPNYHVYLMDFGISKLLGGTVLTRTGIALGTPIYMAPEQVYGLTPLPQTDIYALGVVAFEMLAGRPPFIGKQAIDIMVKHANEAPPLITSLNAGLSQGMDRVMNRVLSKNPQDRYSTASAFMGDFARYIS